MTHHNDNTDRRRNHPADAAPSTAAAGPPPPDPPPPKTIVVADGESRDIPDIGDVDAQAAFETMLEAASPEERDALLDGWDSAEEYAEQKRFVDAVGRGKAAVFELKEWLEDDGTAGRRWVRDLIEEIVDDAGRRGADPWAAGDHLLRIAGLILYGGGEEILRLLRDWQRREVVTVIHEHEDALWSLFESPPDPDEMLSNGSLNDFPDPVWLAVGQVIEALLEHLPEIGFARDETVPAPAKNALCALATFSNELVCYPGPLVGLTDRFIRAMKTTSRAKRDKLLDGIASALRRAQAKRGDLPETARGRLDDAARAVEDIRALPPILLHGDDVPEPADAIQGRPVPSVSLADVLAWDPPPEYSEAKWRRLFGRRTRLTGEDILGLKLDHEDRWWLVTHPPLLTEQQLRLLAADLAERGLPIFERACPGDDRPRRAIEAARAYARGEIDADAMNAAGRASEAAWEAAPDRPAKNAAEAATFAAVTPDGSTAARGAWQTAGQAVHGDAMARKAIDDPDYITVAMCGREDEAVWQFERARQYLRGEA